MYQTSKCNDEDNALLRWYINYLIVRSDASVDENFQVLSTSDSCFTGITVKIMRSFLDFSFTSFTCRVANRDNVPYAIPWKVVFPFSWRLPVWTTRRRLLLPVRRTLSQRQRGIFVSIWSRLDTWKNLNCQRSRWGHLSCVDEHLCLVNVIAEPVLCS